MSEARERPATAPSTGTIPSDAARSTDRQRQQQSTVLPISRSPRAGEHVIIPEIAANTIADTADAGAGAGSRLKAEDLVTCRRFKPHALTQPTLFSTDDVAGGSVALSDGGVITDDGGRETAGGGGDGRKVGVGGREVGGTKGAQGSYGERLLNAWEKIEELEGLVESSRYHNERCVVGWRRKQAL